MSTLKDDKKIPFDKLSSQERQAKYSASPFFKKKNEEDAVWRKRAGAAGNGRGALPSGRSGRQKK